MEKLAPDIYAELASHFGFDMENTGEQILESGMHIYDRSLVEGTPWEIQEESIAVHMCAGSWRDMKTVEREYYTVLKLRMIDRL